MESIALTILLYIFLYNIVVNEHICQPIIPASVRWCASVVHLRALPAQCTLQRAYPSRQCSKVAISFCMHELFILIRYLHNLMLRFMHSIKLHIKLQSIKENIHIVVWSYRKWMFAEFCQYSEHFKPVLFSRHYVVGV